MPERELATTSEAAPAQVASEVAPALPLAAMGNQAVARLAQYNGSRAIARDPAPAPAPGATPAQPGAPGSDTDAAAYATSMRERTTFQGTTFKKDPHQPSTGIGLFAAQYANNSLKITVRCCFHFTSSWWFQYPRARPEDRSWQPGESDRWKAAFMDQIRSVWSGRHTFHCQRDWWEAEFANTDIEVVESGEDPHFECTVQKIPPREWRESSVTSPVFGGMFGGGEAELDSNDVDMTQKRAGQQRESVHEAGHMFGLDDEYGEGGKAEHSDIVEHEGGGTVTKKRDGRIMSNGEEVGTPHGSTFLEILQEMTKLDWGNTPKAPRPVPAGADTAPRGDFPTPAPRGPNDAVAV